MTSMLQLTVLNKYNRKSILPILCIVITVGCFMRPWEVFVWVIWTCLSSFLSNMRLGMKRTGCGWSGRIDWFRPSSWHLPPTVLQSQSRVLSHWSDAFQKTDSTVDLHVWVCVVARGRTQTCDVFTVELNLTGEKNTIAMYC